MSLQTIGGVEYQLCYDFILQRGRRIVGYLEDGVAHLCSQAEAFAAQDRKIQRDKIARELRDAQFWAEVAASEREYNRLLLLCQYHMYGRPDDRVHIEELAAKEQRELYPDEDEAFVRFETRAQTIERWGSVAVRRRRLAVLAWAAARNRIYK